MDIIKNGGSASYSWVYREPVYVDVMHASNPNPVVMGYSASGGREAEEKKPGRGWVVCQRRKGACETGGEEKAVSRERELGWSRARGVDEAW